MRSKPPTSARAPICKLPRPGTRADLADQRIAILAGHPDVRDQDVRACLLEGLQGLARRGHRGHRRAASPEHGRDELSRVRLVVDDEDSNALEVRRLLEWDAGP